MSRFYEQMPPSLNADRLASESFTFSPILSILTKAMSSFCKNVDRYLVESGGNPFCTCGVLGVGGHAEQSGE